MRRIKRSQIDIRCFVAIFQQVLQTLTLPDVMCQMLTGNLIMRWRYPTKPCLLLPRLPVTSSGTVHCIKNDLPSHSRRMKHEEPSLEHRVRRRGQESNKNQGNTDKKKKKNKHKHENTGGYKATTATGTMVVPEEVQHQWHVVKYVCVVQSGRTVVKKWCM